MASAVMAWIDNGSSIRFSSRRRAVTTISSSMAAAEADCPCAATWPGANSSAPASGASAPIIILLILMGCPLEVTRRKTLARIQFPTDGY